MSSIVPPPQERFDPITARWLTPGGPLPDPERDEVDPEHREPVTIVGPVPPELAGAELATSPTGWRSMVTPRQLRWALVALVLLAFLLGGFSLGF
jgi:hypothetical protein